jgi:ubiquinone/menaquinone biosynthesis C-methylase UbiE
VAIGTASAVAGARRVNARFERWVRLLYGRVYGDSDLHTHIRWRAIRRQVADSPTVVDVACGDGSITLELARAKPQAKIRGIDFNEEAIASARRRQSDTGITNVSFEVGDVNDIAFGSVGQALLLDVIEHIDDDRALVASVGRAVEPGGRIVISTPTPNYPRFFGREFHEAVGHVRDGYHPDQVADLLCTAGFSVETVRHYTRLPASLCCALFYRYLWKGKSGLVLSPVLNAISLLDFLWPWNRGASSILVVGTKSAS